MPKTDATLTTDLLSQLAGFDKLRKAAIRSLLKDRLAIDRNLARFGHDGRTMMRAPGKKRLCKMCGKTGHNSRTCPLNTANKTPKAKRTAAGKA